jgi:6-phosphofructokinase
VLATHYGYHALELLMSGERGKLVVLKDGRITHTDIASVAGKQRLVPATHPLLQAARAVGTCMGD